MGDGRRELEEPRSAVVEFARTEDSGDPFAFRFSDQRYLVRDAGGAYGEITVPWRGALWEELETMRVSAETCQRLGDRLRRLLAPASWDRIEAQVRSASAETPLVLTIRSAAAELFALPWDLVTTEGDGRHLAELEHVLVRHEWPGAEAPPPITALPPRILVAWSAAGGAVPSAAHIDAIERACARREVAFDRRRDVLDHASMGALAEALDDRRRPVTALHLLCHGEATQAGAGLIMDADGGEGRALVDGGDLRRVLAQHRAELRLVVLCACTSGSPGERGSHLGSVAQTLHRAGVESVIASRTALSADGSVVFTRHLYRNLLVCSMSLETAMMGARERLLRNTERLDWASIQLYGRSEGGCDTRPFALRPYRGLFPFDEEHRRFFFGRDREVGALSTWAEAAVAGERGLHILLGSTGSGKLSLLRAGLIPTLLRRRDRRWRAAVIRPGDDAERPRSALSLAFKRVMGDALELADGSLPLEALLTALRGASTGDEVLLLVVSRFEEIFTHLRDRATATAYVQALVDLAACPGIAVIATMRTDYVERCAELKLGDGRRLDELLYDDQARTLLGPPGAQELRELILGPARRVGLRLQPALIERLVADIEGEAAALPLLQHTLDLLWTKREGRTLTLAAYEGLGRIAGALARSADAVLAGMSASERSQARCLLIALVDLGVDLVPRGRRRIDREVLRPLVVDARADFDVVVDRLVAGRLIVSGVSMDAPGDLPQKTGAKSMLGARNPIVWLDLAHESLIDRWPTLRGWIEEDRSALLELRRIVSAFQEWRSHVERDSAHFDYLLVGDRLADAIRLSERRPGLIPGPVLAYIRESAELVEASRMRGLIDRLLPIYAIPLALAFLPGLRPLHTDAPWSPSTLIAGLVVFLAVLRAWSWGVIIQQRIAGWSAVDILIHGWTLFPLTILAAWGAAGDAKLDAISAGLPWSAWLSVALASLALGRVAQVLRMLRSDPSDQRWGRAQLLVGALCVAANAGAVASPIAWPLWLLAILADIAATWALRSSLRPSDRDDGHSIAGKIDDAVIVAAGLVALFGLDQLGLDPIDLIGLGALMAFSLVAVSVFALTSRRVVEHRGESTLAGPRWLLARATVLAGIALLGISARSLLTMDTSGGRGLWACATLVFCVGVLLGPGLREQRIGRLLAIVALAGAALCPLITFALLGQAAWIWAGLLAAIAVAGIIALRRPPPASANHRRSDPPARSRGAAPAPDSAALVETLNHTGGDILLPDDPAYKAIVAARRW